MLLPNISKARYIFHYIERSNGKYIGLCNDLDMYFPLDREDLKSISARPQHHIFFPDCNMSIYNRW